MKHLVLFLILICVSYASFAVPPISGPSVVCAGGSILLVDAAPGGTWSSSDISIATVNAFTGVVYGVSLGPVTITYALMSGFTTTTITVVPGAGAIIGVSSLCAGTFTTLTDTPAGGTWTSDNTAVATIDGAGMETAVAAGTTVITYTIPGGCFATLSSTVSAGTAPISGLSSLCAYGAITLSDASSGGTWSSSNPAAATIGSASGIVTGVSSGTTTISYTFSSCGTVVTTVTVLPTPTAISGPPILCNGATATCTDGMGMGTWSSSGAAVTLGSSSGIVNAVATGTANISYTLSSGCFVEYTITVLASPAAITGTDSVCIGTTSPLTDAGSGTWSSSNPAIATIGSSTGIVKGLSAGTVTITYTLSTGCSTHVLYRSYSCPALLIENAIIKNDVIIYPNPATDQLTIKADPGEYYSYSITNATGIKIKQQGIVADLTTMDIKSLPPGLYIIAIKGVNGSRATKFLKE